MESIPCKNWDGCQVWEKLSRVQEHSPACSSVWALPAPRCPPSRNTEQGKKTRGLQTPQQHLLLYKVFSLRLLQARKLTKMQRILYRQMRLESSWQQLGLFCYLPPLLLLFTSASLPAPCFDVLNKMHLFTVSQIPFAMPALKCLDFTQSQGFTFRFQAP